MATRTNSHRNNIASLLLLNDNPSRLRHRIWSDSFRRRILHLIACGAASHHRNHNPSTETDPSDSSSMPPGSGKLSDLLQNHSSSSSSTSSSPSSSPKRRKVEALEEMKAAVRRLADAEDEDDVVRAASEVRRLAKDDPFARETLAMLGVIPPLVEMLGSCDDRLKISSLYALLNLAIGNDLNKAAIVKAGAVHKMLHTTQMASGALSTSVTEGIVANFLGLSALDSNKLIIGSSGAVLFLAKAVMNVDNGGNSQMKQDALRALYNLSIMHSNVAFMLETDLVKYFVNALGDMEISERVLSILSNVVSTAEGRRAVTLVPDALPILVDVLSWNDSPGCQEKVLYVLMAIAHKGYGVRQAMAEAGAMSALLELTLVGSTLAQKRASRILDFLSSDKGKQLLNECNGRLTTTLSAPICGSSSTFNSLDHKQGLEDEDGMVFSEEKKAVNKLVQQSLQNNMMRIALRADLPQEFAPAAHFKTLTLSSTSKSLPF